MRRILLLPLLRDHTREPLCVAQWRGRLHRATKVVVQVCQLVGEFLDLLGILFDLVEEHGVVGGGGHALAAVGRHHEELVEVVFGDLVVDAGAGGGRLNAVVFFEHELGFDFLVDEDEHEFG